ncbi:hypothetical protein C4J90_1909 [Pseudomonas sp. R2-60-08W]|nr:hypothetical protein C4J90_1909 [Pseudomonas sp. R2-60-08W]
MGLTEHPIKRPSIYIWKPLKQYEYQLMPQRIKLPIRNALTAIPQAQGQQTASLDITVDLISGFASQFRENQ